ncbi:hypothetical protein D9758_017799 [Tetrapyrgos nigripes]|uniref:Uncharacterized protein n=1 Tax=Tetrapyrgos nigripes TaxID=182062 RepID=A0A8H5B7A1_9AGAR|nr:hypothetical protein D9758_017799 [Tetrapyrgos nigripes]
MLSFESDRRTVNITINSFNIELSKEQRAKSFPEGNNQLAKADELDQVRAVCENVSEYRSFFLDSPSSGAVNGTEGDGDELSAVSQLEDRFFHKISRIRILVYEPKSGGMGPVFIRT